MKDNQLSKTDSRNEKLNAGTLQEFYANHLKVWRESNLSQAEYCRQNQLHRHRFGYWKRKLQKKDKPVEFVMLPAPVQETATSYSQDQGSPLRLMVGSRVGLEIPDNFSPMTLEKVLHVLQVL